MKPTLQTLFTQLTVFCFFVLSLAVSHPAKACSDVMLKTEGDYAVSCRTMDFSYPLGSRIEIIPRGEKWQSTSQNGAKGFQWSSKFGFVGISVQGLPVISDGLNEKGLSAAVLWLEGTKYPEPKDKTRAISIEDSLRWILGSFASVAELKKGLENVELTGHYIKAMHMFPPLHISVHDAAGNSLVIEFTNAQIKLYDNPNGVLTNQPDFEFQTKNLAYREWKLKLARSAVGVPGEWYPVERFERASIVRSSLPTPTNLAQAIAQGVHVLNTVQVQYKAPGTDSEGGKQGDFDHTLWSVVRDHKTPSIYWRSKDNQSLQFLDFAQIDFSGKTTYAPVEITQGNWFIPVKPPQQEKGKAQSEPEK